MENEKTVNLIHKQRIIRIHKAQDALRCQLADILDIYLGEGEGQWHVIDVEEWGCPKSPIGLCVYRPFTDRAHDNCIFCHEPQERK